MDIRPAILESCALEKKGYMRRRGGSKHGRVKVGAANTKNLAYTRRRRREKVSVGPGLRECDAGYEERVSIWNRGKGC